MTPSGVLKLYVHNLLKQLDTKIAIDSLILSEVMMFTKVLHVHACSCVFWVPRLTMVASLEGNQANKSEYFERRWNDLTCSDTWTYVQILKSDPFWFILNMFDLFEGSLFCVCCHVLPGSECHYVQPASLQIHQGRAFVQYCTILYNYIQLLILYNCFSQCMSIFASFVHFVQQFTGIWWNLT